MKRACSLSLVFALILAGSALAAPGDGDSPAPEGTREAYAYDWVFFYYMAYDNNLEACGRPILDMLAKGITSERAAVVCSADFRDTEGMHRYELTTKGERLTKLDEEGSAEEETLAAELAWVGKNYRARKYAVIFLNHGGRLGEMSYDEHPGREGGQEWLYPPEVAKVLGAWRKEVPGEVELMFYQQCGKGTLENYYAMKDVARFVMGSQTVVGAPNYYYTDALAHACQNPDIDGLELAKQITNHETANMFTTYTTFAGEALQELPSRVDAVLQPLLAVEGDLARPRLSREFRPCFNFGRAELFFDGLALLEQLYAANSLDAAPVASFAGWVRDALIVNHRVSPLKQSRAGGWCGFSIFFPTRATALERYARDYGIYAVTQLDELLLRLLGRTVH